MRERERITARIVALGALLVLLQACGGGGGGGGGGSSMMMCPTGQVRDSDDNECRAPETDAECMRLDAMMPVFVGDACRAECGEGQTRNMTTHECETSMPMPVTCTDPAMPFSHGDDCHATCPDAAPIPNTSNVCEAAMRASDCPTGRRFFHSGACSVACPDAAPIPNTSNVCMIAASHEECRMANSAMPIRNTDGSCEAAISAAQCMTEHSLMFLHDGACSAACPDAAPIPNSSNECMTATSHAECRMANPAMPIQNNGACEAAISAAQCMTEHSLMFLHDGACSAECPDAAPIPNTSNVCEAAANNAACLTANPARPIENSGACEAAISAAQCVTVHSLMFLHDGACLAACPDAAPAHTNNVCRPRVAGDCPDARPVFVDGTSPCRVAQNASECPDDEPVFDTGSSGSCRIRGAGGGTVAISLDGTDVVFDETIDVNTHTPAYDEIFDAARNEPNGDITTQSGNCGSSSCMQTQDRISFLSSPTGIGSELMFESLAIRKSLGGLVQYVLDEETTPMDADEDDRREDDLDGWDYRRYEMRGGAADPSDRSQVDQSQDANTAEADFIEWNNTSKYYLAGGVWAYDVGKDSEIRGAGTLQHDSSDGILASDPFPTTDSAMYTGHSFGYYAVLPAPHPAGKSAEPNRGYFAANARLTANFTGMGGTISGTIDNFLFSTDKRFREGDESALEDALGGPLGLTVMLEKADGTPGSIDTSGITTVINFTGDTSASVMVDGAPLMLRGKYGGLFYESQGDTNDPEAPLAVGGTWGAAGATTNPAPTAGTDGGFGISFIGAFGAKVVPPPSPP